MCGYFSILSDCFYLYYGAKGEAKGSINFFTKTSFFVVIVLSATAVCLVVCSTIHLKFLFSLVIVVQLLNHVSSVIDFYCLAIVVY